MSHERYLSSDLHFLMAIVGWGEISNNFENSRNCDVRHNVFTKKIRIKNYFLMDTYSMILAWVQR